MAGLELLEPGYRRVRVAPRPGGGITRARTHHDAPAGRIEAEWRLEGGFGHLDSTLPEPTTAEIRLPDGTAELVGPGTHHHRWTAP